MGNLLLRMLDKVGVPTRELADSTAPLALDGEPAAAPTGLGGL